MQCNVMRCDGRKRGGITMAELKKQNKSTGEPGRSFVSPFSLVAGEGKLLDADNPHLVPPNTQGRGPVVAPSTTLAK